MEFEQIATMDIEPRVMGMRIAAANHEEQCEFFVGLADGFEEFGSEFLQGTQLVWIRDNLSQRGKKLIKRMARNFI